MITQSFGAAEETFSGTNALQNLRHAFISAQQNGVTVLASSGDNGSANVAKQPVKTQPLIPFQTVGWPASDPLVTGVGGTYLCTNATAQQTDPRTLDNVSLPTTCRPDRGRNRLDRCRRWLQPRVQPAGLPEHAAVRQYGDPRHAARRAGPRLPGELTHRRARVPALPPDGNSGVICQPSNTPCSTGWYDIGGTSLASPQVAGLVAIADQKNGGGLGLINPALYKMANGPNYAADFFDVTTGNNGAFAPDVPGFPATTGWDPVTGLGTPDAANFVPDLVAASH